MVLIRYVPCGRRLLMKLTQNSCDHEAKVAKRRQLLGTSASHQARSQSAASAQPMLPTTVL